MRNTTLVIPCYNESSRLDLEQFRTFGSHEFHICFLFVDDGSTDDTFQLLSRLSAEDPEAFEVMRLPHNMGKAEAVRRGILKASQSDVRYVGFWDADLSAPLNALPQFVDTLNERPDLSFVMGSRVRLLGRHINRSSGRHYLGRIFATAVSLMLRLPVYDTQCGAKLFRNDTSVIALFAEPFRTRWIFDVEFIARMLRDLGRGGSERICELPLLEWRDVEGSKLRSRDFAHAAVDLARIYWHYLGPRRTVAATLQPEY